MNKTNINTSWLRRGAWGIVVLLVGLLLGSCGTAGPTGETPGDGNGPEEPVLKTLPAKCLTVEANGEITAFDDEKEDCKLKEFAIPGEVPAANPNDDPITITTIKADAFKNKGLTKLSIPNSVITIGAYAFLKNELTSITIPDSVTTIGASAFSNNQLTSLTIGSKVNMIRTSAFAANKLESVSIPKSVTKIENGAFNSNPLKTVILDPNPAGLEFGDSFSNGDLWTAYSTGANKDKAGTWTWDGSAWSFTPK